ncbi:MAG TPA: T9SS type A sorting domain-containing protein, partial [Bacteroidales bacterium]|nr:T9SS type A sorting domain-containing protein [Bacteroidales bacterium]
SGTATFESFEPVEAEATIDADNNELVFVFILGGLNESANVIKFSLAPNPVTMQSRISIFSDRNESVSLGITDFKGQQLGQMQQIEIQKGTNHFLLQDYLSTHQLKNGVYILNLNGQTISKQVKVLIKH